MATLKLKQPAAPKAATKPRAPVRGQGPKRPRPTLAQAQAERAQQRAEAPPPRERPPASAPRDRAEPASRRDREAAPPPRPRGTVTPRPPLDRPPLARSRTAAPPRAQGEAPARAQPGRGAATSLRRPPPNETHVAPTVHAPGSLRLSKQMTTLGLASRREADEWIAQGFVRVDGRIVDTLGARVLPGQRIEIDPQARQQQAQRVTVLLHKPLGVVSGQAEDDHRPALTLVTPEHRWRGDASTLRFNASHLRQLVPAGRLDLDSTGLLVLTQDGRVAKALIGADSTIEKEYLVKVRWNGHPEVDDLKAAFPAEQLARLRHGLVLDDRVLQPAKVSWQSEQQLRIVLREGMKRQIRRMCEEVGLQVVALKRIRIGRISLGDLPPGQWRYLAPWESFG